MDPTWLSYLHAGRHVKAIPPHKGARAIHSTGEAPDCWVSPPGVGLAAHLWNVAWLSKLGRPRIAGSPPGPPGWGLVLG